MRFVETVFGEVRYEPENLLGRGPVVSEFLSSAHEFVFELCHDDGVFFGHGLAKVVGLDEGEAGHAFPMTDIARDEIGSPQSVNMVALGVVAALDGAVKLESLKKSIKERVPDHTKKQNLAALMAGYNTVKTPTKPKKAKVRPKNRKS